MASPPLTRQSKKGMILKSTDTLFHDLKREITKTIVGQDKAIELLLVTLLAGGHSILEGVPGLAKTLLINSLAKTMDLSFNRVQFTPDLIPSDITGTEIIQMESPTHKGFRFLEGPVFSHVLLADEINRTPPKTQSALLEAMQEKAVTVLGKTYPLPDPFVVFATQNPIEHEGTYPLPEAQLDRFLFHINLDYPSRDEELAIVNSDPENLSQIKAVIGRESLEAHKKACSQLPVPQKLQEYAVDLVRSTRPQTTSVEAVKKFVSFGCGPRATRMLVKAAQAYAYLSGMKITEKEALDQVYLPALRHRTILNYHAAADGVTAESILLEIKKGIEAQL